MDKFNNGLSFVRDQLKNHTSQHIPVVERWRENRFAFIALINVPYYTGIFSFREDVLGLTCMLATSVVSVFMLYYKDIFDTNQLVYSADYLMYFEDVERKAMEIIEMENIEEQNEWYEMHIRSDSELEKNADSTFYGNDRKKRLETINKLRNIAVYIFALALANECANSISEMKSKLPKSHLPKWMFHLVIDENFVESKTGQLSQFVEFMQSQNYGP